MPRDCSLEHLHPVFRSRVEELINLLDQQQLPFRLFEGFRSPQRQANLYAKGRTKPGPVVTRARPWRSYHQYGIAADFVLHIDGRWSWDDRGGRAQWWNKLHSLAEQVGLEPLSWEKPHLQLKGMSLNDLHAGGYPEGGDDPWAENLQDAIDCWAGPAPPLPESVPQRPAIAADEPTHTQAPHAPPKRYRVIARSGLRLRTGASPQFDTLEVLPLNQEVSVLATRGDWCLVDIQGDGIADGYCFGGYLSSQNQE